MSTAYFHTVATRECRFNVGPSNDVYDDVVNDTNVVCRKRLLCL